MKTSILNRIALISLGLLIVGTAGYSTLRGFWFFYLFAHAGALGVMGLLAVAIGMIAKKKGYDFITAFLVGFVIPIVLGLALVLVIRYTGDKGTPFYCGGSVCLAAAVLILIGYILARRKTPKSRPI
ncbi:MAG: hypothetical protein JSV52_14340 [Candidatus Zixiibacteriota bacterium]|nr:MAG: hypothetical protein JSV52_14340 [candidate division Zixibacteria bacterium]